LSQAALVKILSTLFVGRQTGRLVFTRDDDETLELRFISGHIVSGSSQPIPGRLGEIMTRSGILSRSDLDQSFEQARREGRRLGPVLVERRVATLPQIEEALRLQVRGVLFTAFFWAGGAYGFEANDGSPASLEEISLRLCTPQLIVEMVGSLNEPVVVREALGDLNRRLGAVDDPRVRLEGVTLSPGDAFVLSRADGTLTANEILDITPLPRETVERSLLALLCVGVVEWRSNASLRALQLNQTVALSAQGVREAIEARHAHETDVRLREIDQVFQGLLGKTHHDVLGLPNGASASEVSEAYQKLTRRFHPDTAGQVPAEQVAKVKAIFMRVSEAFNALRSAAQTVRADPAPAPAPAVHPQAEAAAPAAAASPEPEPVGRLEDILAKAEEALASRPWESLAAVERVLAEATGPMRQRARILRARAQLKNPISCRAGEQELRQLQQEDPALLDAPLLLGGFYRDRGLTARAAHMFSRVLELRPGHRRASEELRALPLVETDSEGARAARTARA
jgi:Domain of unknown function (DUF4388)/DnaJ domain